MICSKKIEYISREDNIIIVYGDILVIKIKENIIPDCIQIETKE